MSFTENFICSDPCLLQLRYKGSILSNTTLQCHNNVLNVTVYQNHHQALLLWKSICNV